ncbi:MAG: SRPBCC family protein [Anaerolineae bacterium]|nr:SRPBCC family protein [Anaerolineae bacterium]
MASVVETKKIDIDQETLWRLLCDIPRYAEWQVVPAGKVTQSTVTRDAGVLKGSARRIECTDGSWYEEEFFDAAAPNYVAYRVVRDSSGKFSRTYKELTISVRVVEAPEGGVNVTLGVNYAKAGLGRWIDIGGPGSWRRAFKRSLENLSEVAARSPAPEAFTPAWRKPAPAPAPVRATPPEKKAPAVPAIDTADIDAEMEKLHAMKKQLQEMNLSTAEIDARLAATELKKLHAVKKQLQAMDLSTAEIDARIAELEAK